jgi:ketosteroid isomerase-like protein
LPNGKAYTTDVRSARGGRLVFEQRHEDGRVFTGSTNGGYVWTRDAATGRVEPGGAQLASMVRGHEFQMMPIDLRERYTNLSVDGTEAFAGHPCIRVRMTDDLGNPGHLYFSEETKLFSGMVLQDPREAGATVRVVADAWRQVGAVRLPATVTATDRAGDFVLDFTEIRLNDVDETVFNVPDRIVWIAELMELHEMQRAAHVERDAARLVAIFADDFMSVDAGRIDRPERAASQARLQAYFDRSTFLEWDDISPPIVRVSDDGSMAYVIVHKRVRLRAANDPGAEEQESVFAWTSTYERRDGRWQLTSVASTRVPEPK